MTTDFHVHQPSSRGVWGLEPFPAADYIATMDRYGIGHSVVLPLDGLFFDPRTTNDELALWCAPHRDRLTPFCTVEPRAAGAADEVERCVREHGMRGVKFHPWLQGFFPTEPCVEPVAERAVALGVPLLFHDGTPPYSTPLQVAELARRYPELTVILGHGGLYDMWPEAVAAARRHENVQVCMTSLPPYPMRRLVESVPVRQLLFGSDGGLAAVDRQSYVGDRWQMFRTLGLDDDVVRAVTVANPARLLGSDVV